MGNGCKTNWRIDDQTYDVNISWHMDALFLSGVEYFLISADGYLNREFFNPFPISLRVREDAKVSVHLCILLLECTNAAQHSC